MKSIPRIGLAGELQFVVESKHAIDFATDGMPAVLSTPNLIGLLERTARQTLAPFLDSDERSVGIEIELRHLAATPVGASVTCSARVVSIDGKHIGFQIEARDSQDLIAKGFHKRAVIRIARFAERVQRKSG
ncbi:MAG TPA: thioesterase family protein [Verrucomicrobiae bacterium]|nr:thioesterase family protein [Verrucomicrobiae bacterium]